MAAITSFQDALERMATKGFFLPGIGISQAATTAPASTTSGFFAVYPALNQVGTTLWSTLVGAPVLPTPDAPALLCLAGDYANNNRGRVWGWLYKIGTLNLAATGEQFTHDAATFPLLRTKMGQAAQPVSLIPIIVVSTATTVTAAVFTMKNGAGSTGYVDQDGNTVVGTKAFTMPAAATALGSGFILPIEESDTAIRDIQQIEVTTAATAGAAIIFGFEPMAPMSVVAVGLNSFLDTLGDHLILPDIRPAVATSGTVTGYFGPHVIGVSGQSNVNAHHYMGFKNT